MISVEVKKTEIDGEKAVMVKTDRIQGNIQDLVAELIALTRQIYFYIEETGFRKGQESAPFIFRFVMEMLHEVPFLEQDIIPAVEDAFKMLEQIDEKGGNQCQENE